MAGVPDFRIKEYFVCTFLDQKHKDATALVSWPSVAQGQCFLACTLEGPDMLFFSALRVFIWHNPTGRYSWSALSWDPSRTNKHGRLHPAYADVPCLIHRWIWAVFLQQPEAVNLTESMSHTHTHMQTAHINADCQSPIERRDTTETNMSAPEARAAIILSGKLLWCEEKNNNVCLLILTVCVLTGTKCVFV